MNHEEHDLGDSLKITKTEGRQLNAPGTWISPHHDVIDHRNPDDFSRLLQPLRHTDILVTGSRIATRMIVDCDETIRCIPDRRPKHFSRMHPAVPECTHCDLMAVDRHVLRVQSHDPEFLLLTLTGHTTELLQAELNGRGRTGDPSQRTESRGLNKTQRADRTADAELVIVADVERGSLTTHHNMQSAAGPAEPGG